MADLSDYAATIDLSDDLIREAFRVAEYTGGTLGLTKQGRLVITLPEGSERADRIFIDDAVFTYGSVIPGTDSVLIFDL